MTKAEMNTLTFKTGESLSKAAQDFREGKTEMNKLPEGWAPMPSIPVSDGPSETLNLRQKTACRDFLEGRLRDSDGKLFTEYSKEERAGKAGWLKAKAGVVD